MAKARVIPKQGFSESSDSYAKQQLANALDQTRREVNTQPFSSGLWIRDIAIQATSNKQVQHNLGHVPSGYIITKSLNGDGVYQTAADADTITFRNPTASAVTIDVWLF